MGTRRTGDRDRLVEQRLAALLQPGPRHALLPPETAAPLDREEGEDTDDDTLVGDSPEPAAIVPGLIADAADEGDADLQDDEEEIFAGREQLPLPRRRRGALSGLIQLLPIGSLAGFGRPQLAVIAVIVALGVLFGGWAVLRARPVAIGAPRLTATAGSAATGGPISSAPATGPPSSPAASPTRSPTATNRTTDPRSSPDPSSSVGAATIRVHVLGAVHEPGVVKLPTGARVQDALTKAGGTKKSARLGDLNLAQPLADGQQVFVGHGKRDSEVRDPQSGPPADSAATAPSTGASGSAAASGAAQAGGPVDLNSATLEQLDELPGVGPVTAQKILDWRSEHGKFSTVDELQEVDGIGPKTFADLKPEVTV